MKVDRRSHFLLALFGLVAACASACVSQSLISGLLPLWAVCWQAMKIHPGGALWLSLLARLAILALAAFGSLTLLRRLWKTQRFVSGLNAASATAHPARLAQLCSRLNLYTRISVLATDVPLAFCVGLLRPRIYLSAGLIDVLTDGELKAVLLHEDHHRRRLDPLRSLLAEVLSAAFFFLPIAAELRDLFLMSAELEADRHAARLAGQRSLAGALHKILTHQLASRSSLSGVVGTAPLTATEARLAQLLGDRPSTPHISLHGLSISTVILILLCMLV